MFLPEMSLNNIAQQLPNKATWIIEPTLKSKELIAQKLLKWLRLYKEDYPTFYSFND
jgi:hypothetical protein